MSSSFSSMLLAEASDPTTSGERLTQLSAEVQLRTMVAGNPSAPAQLLETLAYDQDEVVRASVAGNPNTPWQILEHLAWEFPQAFLTNPMSQMQLLSHPEQITTEKSFWDAMLRTAPIPLCWWKWLSNHPELHTIQSRHLHIHITGEARSPFGNPQHEDPLACLLLVELLTATFLQNHSLPALPDALYPDSQARTSRLLIEERLRWLASHTDLEIRQAIARNPLLPPDLMAAFAQESDVSLRVALAENPQLPATLLQKLALDSSQLEDYLRYEVLWAVGAHAHTPRETLLALAQDPDASLRARVAAHPQMPVEVACLLATDSEGSVRASAADHPLLPTETLQILAQDQTQNVRWAVARHPSTSQDTLQTLAGDETELVRSTVARKRRTPPVVLQTLASDPSRFVRASVAENLSTPQKALYMLARDPEVIVRRSLTTNLQLSEDLLGILAQDNAWQVRSQVAGHPQMPTEPLQILRQDQRTEVRAVADFLSFFRQEVPGHIPTPFLGHINSSQKAGSFIESHLDQVENFPVPVSVRQHVLTWLAASWEQTMIRQAFLAFAQGVNLSDTLQRKRLYYQRVLSFSLPPLALQKLATSPSWEIRYLVALHANTSQEARLRLCEDGNCYVRAMAKAQCK